MFILASADSNRADCWGNSCKDGLDSQSDPLTDGGSSRHILVRIYLPRTVNLLPQAHLVETDDGIWGWRGYVWN